MQIAIDSVEFSDREDDEGVASDFADIVTQMAQDVSHFCRVYVILCIYVVIKSLVLVYVFCLSREML